MARRKNSGEGEIVSRGVRRFAAPPLATLALVGQLGLVLLMNAAVADAGDFRRPVNVHIPAQCLASALTELADQADLQILFPQELVSGLRAPAMSGSFSAREALERLLAGADLEFVIRGRDTVIIRALHSS